MTALSQKEQLISREMTRIRRRKFGKDRDSILGNTSTAWVKGEKDVAERISPADQGDPLDSPYNNEKATRDNRSPQSG